MLPKKKNLNQSGQKISNSVNIYIKFTIFSFHFVAKQDCPKRKKILNSTQILLNSRDIQWYVCTEVLKYGTNKHCLAFFFPFSTNLNVEEKLYKDNEQFTYVFNMIFLD